jgi:hypothetical protein
METIIGALLGSAAYRIRGGGVDLWLGKVIGKREGWTPSNGYGRAFWALFVMLSLPLGYHSPFIFALAFLGVLFGYFGGEFNLELKENRTWKNYALLSARGAFIMLPLALTYGSLYCQLWYGVVAGLLFVPCYLIDALLKKYSSRNWGEILLGAAIGGVLWTS